MVLCCCLCWRRDCSLQDQDPVSGGREEGGSEGREGLCSWEKLNKAWFDCTFPHLCWVTQGLSLGTRVEHRLMGVCGVVKEIVSHCVVPRCWCRLWDWRLSPRPGHRTVFSSVPRTVFYKSSVGQQTLT